MDNSYLDILVVLPPKPSQLDPGPSLLALRLTQLFQGPSLVLVSSPQMTAIVSYGATALPPH